MKKQSKTSAKEPKKKTAGTIMAEKLRAEVNRLSNSERAELLKQSLAMIYKGRDNSKSGGRDSVEP